MANQDPPQETTEATPASSFEESLSELEQIVQQMESGELSLEQSLEAFERGIKLTRACQQALSKAEQKVQALTEQDGEVSLAAFDPTDDEDDHES